MTDQHTPTTEQVRLDYVMAYAEKESSQLLAEADFDRWLAERDRQIAEKTWDDAIGEAMEQGTIQIPDNPYRKK